MSRYVKCRKNDTYFKDDLAQTFADLTVGQVYKQMALYPQETDSGMVRVIDGSGEPYLYPAEYFEPLLIRGGDRPSNQQLTIRLDEITKGVLHAEAVAAKKSISALLRAWIDERLDLPESGD
jgi:hypothetical protein